MPTPHPSEQQVPGALQGQLVSHVGLQQAEKSNSQLAPQASDPLR